MNSRTLLSQAPVCSRLTVLTRLASLVKKFVNRIKKLQIIQNKLILSGSLYDAANLWNIKKSDGFSDANVY